MEKLYTITQKEGYSLITNPGGAELTMAEPKIKEFDGLAFKNLSGAAELLPYEDWRLSPEERAKDLAARLDAEQIAGLMLFSTHQAVPAIPGGPFGGSYGGKTWEPGMDPAALSDQQKGFMTEENIRNILLTTVQDAATAARWNNNLQAMAEQGAMGIPVCISSDPRHAAGKKNAEFSGTGTDVSRWPEGMGLAAMFDPDLVEEFAKVVAQEYRALGITLALGPQIDTATEPRWMRFEDTYGTRFDMTAKMARAYCDGLQTTEGSETGWGKDSVAAMVKHWPGGGTGESGRDAHYAYGKYAVYPGGKFEEHKIPFTEGAFRLKGATKVAASVMPYYTISWNQDKRYGENVGNSYSRYIISDLLRQELGYEGVVCTDWGVANQALPIVGGFGACSHGAEHLGEAERYLKILMNGVDMYGGASRKAPVLDAYRLGCEQVGKDAMDARLRRTAERILLIFFRLGLFENPYLDPAESAKIVGRKDFVEAGLDAQRKSLVLLKDKGILPLKKGAKLYVPGRHIGEHMAFFRIPVPAADVTMLHCAEPYFTLVDTPQEADAALCMVESPLCDCYHNDEYPSGQGNGYYPISLQYRPYTAVDAREHSIAKGDPREKDCDRTYKGKTTTAYNSGDLDLILNAREQMGDKPVIVSIQLHNPCVVSEFEEAADVILADFGIEPKVLLEALAGESQPQGRLPFTMPRDMETVEHHCEDVPDDMVPYTDSMGNTYDYGYKLR